MKLDLQSEKYGPLGNITGRGVTRALGRPNLSLLNVLVRETIQNSLDARRAGVRKVSYSLRAATRRGAALQRLRDALSGGKGKGFLPLKQLFDDDEIVTLVIGDRGTYGLNGPTRADDTEETERRNFVDFFRNIGESPAGLGTGGTYGYGKAVLFLASEVNTILVFTRAWDRTRPELRLMGMTLFGAGNEMSRGPKVTGRHWWGQKARDGVVEPVRGHEAERTALRLGFSEFGEECGTQLMILAPKLARTDMTAAVRGLLEHGLLYAWPWTVGLGATKAKLELIGDVEGESVPVPGIDEYTGLREMAEALRSASTGESKPPVIAGKSLPIRCERPNVDLGQLELRRFFRTGHQSMPSALFEGTAPGLAKHVAWMRAARLVVRYYEGPASPSPDIEYTGVFVADGSNRVERAFADAEPPTHDDWSPEFVDAKEHETLVRVGVRRIKQGIEEFIMPRRSTDGSSEGHASGWFASGLAALLPGARGNKPGREPSGTLGGGGTAIRHARIDFTGSETWLTGRSAATVDLEYAVNAKAESRAARVTAEPEVIVGDGSTVETEAPANASGATVLGWYTDEGEQISADASVHTSAFEAGNLRLRLEVPEDAMISVKMRYELDA